MPLQSIVGDRIDIRLVNRAITPLSIAIWSLDDDNTRVALDPTPTPTAAAQCRLTFADGAEIIVTFDLTVTTPTDGLADTLTVEALVDLTDTAALTQATDPTSPIVATGFWDLLLEGAGLSPTIWRPVWGFVDLRRAITGLAPAPEPEPDPEP